MRAKCALPLSSCFPTADRLKPVETGIFILGVSARRAPPKIWTMYPPIGRVIGRGGAVVTEGCHWQSGAVNLSSASLPPCV